MKQIKIVSILLTLVLLLMIPVASAAESTLSGICGDNLTWTLVDGILTIFGTGTMTNYEDQGAPWYGMEAIQSVVIEDGVTTIGNNAFSRCFAGEVIIADTVEIIGVNAFYNCDGLSAVTIPNSVVEIRDGAFRDCSSLNSLTIPQSVTEIGEDAFRDCGLLSTIKIPANVTRIGSRAFLGCCEADGFWVDEGNLNYCSDENGVLYTKDMSVLMQAPELLSGEYEIPDTVATIDGYAFYRCSGLTAVSISPSVRYIGSYTFCDCSSLAEIVIPEGVTNIYSHVFARCSKLVSVTLPEGLESIGAWAFSGCNRLSEVQIPDTVYNIDSYAFYGCESLPWVLIPEKVRCVNEAAFFAAGKLNAVTLSANVTEICDSAFGACSALTTVFYGGTEAQRDAITLGADNEPLMNATWHYEAQVYEFEGHKCIFCPDCASFYYPDGTDAQPFFNGTCGENLTWTLDHEGVLTISGTGLMTDYSSRERGPWMPYYLSIKKIVIEDGVTGIGNVAFSQCYAVQSVSIPESVKSIGQQAFLTCKSLTSVILPSGLTEISDFTFGSCSSLTGIEIPSGVTELGFGAFQKCAALKSITIPSSVTYIQMSCFGSCTSLSEVIIGEGLQTIEDSAFYECTSLNSVTFPASLQYMGELFYLSSVSEVTFLGDAPQIGPTAFSSMTLTAYYPSGNATWTEDVLQDYDGTVTWIGMGAQPTLTGKSISLSFEDEILLNFYFIAENLETDELGMLVFYTDPGAVDMELADACYDAVYDSDSGRYMSQTAGIPAKEMGDTRYYAAYAKRSDGTYVYSPLYDYSPKEYALSRLEKSTDENMKALCVAMLNYGAAAQTYFGYKTEDLMNASLTADQQALVTAYAAELFTGAVAAEESKIGEFVKTDMGFSKKTASVSFDGALAINYYFTPDSAVDGDITFYYWTAEDYTVAETLMTANASGKMTMVAGTDGRYWGQVSSIAAKQLDETFYVAAVYTSDGVMCCSGVVAYSLSKYCVNNAVDGNVMQPLASAAAIYGYHAKVYFG